MKYKEFVVAAKEHSDRLADLLRAAGVRFKQRLVNDPARRSVYTIWVHPEDLGRAVLRRPGRHGRPGVPAVVGSVVDVLRRRRHLVDSDVS